MPGTPEAPEATGQPLVWSVSALLRAVAEALASRLGACTVRGELSGHLRAGSGHHYFTLKDAGGQIRCAMFRRAASLLDFEPGDGQLVEVRGRLSVYEPRGDLQLIVEAMRPAGQGNLYEQFLRLKAKLEAQGLFDPARKRPLPAMPRRIGVITSTAAAALRDVCAALARRAPHVPVRVLPSLVQGTQAPADLVRALQLVAQAQVDVVILCRGGGAIEDLWAFNDEAVARAIAACPVPVICGVGHETDFTIADFVADLRAPTPTAAAELAAPARDSLMRQLDQATSALTQALRRRLDQAAQRLDRAALRLARPRSLMQAQQQRLALAAQRLQAALGRRCERAGQAQQAAGVRLVRAAHVQIERQRLRLQGLEARLGSVDPDRVLARGYAYVTDAQGNGRPSAQAFAPGDTALVHMADAQLRTEVRGVEPLPKRSGGSRI